MRSLLKHGMEVVAERRQRIVLGTVRSVGTGSDPSGEDARGLCSVEIPGEAAGGKRVILNAMLPIWFSGVTATITEGDFVLVLLGASPGQLPIVVWRYPGGANEEELRQRLESEVTSVDQPSNSSSGTKLEGGAP